MLKKLFKKKMYCHSNRGSEVIVLSLQKKNYKLDKKRWGIIEKKLETINGMKQITNPKTCMVIEKRHDKKKGELIEEIKVKLTGLRYVLYNGHTNKKIN